MFDGVARWWDGFELWLAQQWFPVQFMLVVAVLLPLCVGLTWLLRLGVDVVLTLPGRLRRGRGDAATSEQARRGRRVS
ncbi:hypothetical protein BJF85_01235 [Saccharomonospora sp. CUA-673]|uniref:hypothetical protein n=1 Tax=Saccharomonospora sp. CUA-673 TaxID=1904969 RepID=UPI0009602DCB|nr:hypothetical protein [Saccharomonospora sp. CUA-673]OLT47058.1 hypothetical protein BJF85_01235 [Saccharomonospora sp. CUA-673]